MTNEELLIPRVMVVALYPNSPFEIGDILQPIPDASNPWYGRIGDTWGVGDIIIESDVLAHPHLFKPLQWWECRDVKDLPEYIKPNHINTELVSKAIWSVDKMSKSGFCLHIDSVSFDAHMQSILPATEAEYLEYLKSKQ